MGACCCRTKGRENYVQISDSDIAAVVTSGAPDPIPSELCVRCFASIQLENEILCEPCYNNCYIPSPPRLIPWAGSASRQMGKCGIGSHVVPQAWLNEHGMCITHACPQCGDAMVDRKCLKFGHSCARNTEYTISI